jgi:hypothetical protein
MSDSSPPPWQESQLVDQDLHIITLGRTPPDGWSVWDKDLYLYNTLHSQRTSIPPYDISNPQPHQTSGSQTHNVDRATTRYSVLEFWVTLTGNV